MRPIPKRGPRAAPPNHYMNLRDRLLALLREPAYSPANEHELARRLDLNKKQRALAARWLASAAALQQAIDLSRRPPDRKSASTPEQARTRVQSVYFRVQQADYFLETSGEPGAQPLADLARRWFQKSLQLLDSDPAGSENYADATARVVAALESLAQANVLENRQKKQP